MGINILDELKNDFIVYAQEVNNNRAFPDARDGLKVSQRAVLWEMFDKKYSSNKPHVKSAKVDGGVIANWHPHGSEYSTIVRMSQDWVNNIPEISFHGANGSLIGGPEAAASRYTECRLSEASEEGLFPGINKDVVDFQLNYSEDEKWPKVFPAILPRLFINGSQGIGYTIAQEWEPGNLVEFVDKVKQYIDKKDITYDDIYPDYPTGGIIINKKDIPEIYKTGKGSIVVRAKTEICDNIIKITELPYQVYAESLIQKIKDLVNQETLSGIEDIYNKSDDNGLLIEIECSKHPQVVLNQLFKLTSLQATFSANQMALVNGIPQMLNLKDYIKVYLEHNLNCLKREYTFDLNKAKDRLEIVTGLLKAISIIDDIIGTIKASKSVDEAKQKLISKFTFTENQAKAIVDMRLGKLANLEQKSLENELAELNKTISKCEKILSSEKAQDKEFLKRLDTFVEKYKWDRRTEVIDLDLIEEKSILKANAKEVEDKYVIVLTKGNHIKKILEADYKVPKKVLNDNDVVRKSIVVGPKDRFILISTTGLMYKLEANKIDECSINSNGMNLEDILNDTIVNIFVGNETQPNMFFVTQKGLVKKMLTKEAFNISKNVGAQIMILKDNDLIIDCILIDDKPQTLEYKVKDKIIKLQTNKFNLKTRYAGGVIGTKLKEGQKLEVK